MKYKNQLVVFNDYIRLIEEDLKSKAPKFTGALVNSIVGTVDIKEENPSFGFDYLQYGDFMDQGVNGTEINWGSPYSFGEKMPPIKSLSSWANAYNINTFALSKSIQKKGIKPRNFTSNVDNLINQFGDEYVVAYWEDYADEENQKGKKNKKNSKK